MKPKERRAALRRMRGLFSSRLSGRPKGRRHREFRLGPEFFRLAVESLAEYALITTDTELSISSWSGPAAAMFGYEESEIIGQSISRLFTPEDLAEGIDKEEFRRALKHGRQDDERWHLRKDGRRLWCYGLSFPLKDEKGEVRGFIKLIRDDTERKKKDDLLRESEERLRLASESTGLGTWDYDVASRALMLSARAAELFGLGVRTKASAFEQFAEKVHPEDRERVIRDFARCAEAGGDCQSQIEYRVVMPDGTDRWVRTLARAFHKKGEEKGRPWRLLGTVVDVTGEQRRLSESESRERELEERVKERTAGLTALNKELETFAYSASHDLRAPLRKIAAFSQAILRSGESALGPADKDRFGRIRAAAAKMQRLIDDMLSLAQVSRKPITLGNCDLSAVARSIAAELRRTAPARNVEFVIAEGLRVRGDCELLSVALRNLLENAWKFTSRHPRARIELGATTSGGRTVYHVKDDGAGFDPRFAHKLFGAFERLHSEQEFPGTGVGLGLVERVVRRHRGRIWAEGGVEEGAAFYFTLHTEDA